MKFESPPFCTKKAWLFLHKNWDGVLFEFQYPGDLGTRTLGACWAKEIDMNFHVDFFMPVGLRKAALSNSPVDCCNQPGFPQKSESNRGLRIDALFILRYFPEKFVFKLK